MTTLPQMTPLRRRRVFQTAFRGYNHSLAAGGQDFYDTQNVSLDQYPALTVRSPGATVRHFQRFNGLFDKEGLLWADGEELYYKGEYIGPVRDCKKTFVSMGPRVLIWPDKLMLDTQTLALTPLTAEAELFGAEISLSRADGTDLDPTVSPIPPESPENGCLWLDVSETEYVLKSYSASDGGWTVLPSYIKITHPDLPGDFRLYDGVTLLGATLPEGPCVISGMGEGWIALPGAVYEPETGHVTLQRPVPDMDFLAQSDNRVWGCSSRQHEIYACKLGDPTNWYCYQGLSTDSYAATVGSDGPFTGAVAHLGSVLFFKENCLHRVFGSRPGNYQITNTPARGVRAGAEATLAVVNESLYYLSPAGIVRYDGALPVSAGEALGTDRFASGVGGAFEGKYFVSLQNADGVWNLFSYHEEKGFWLREDRLQALALAKSGDELYLVDGNGRMTSRNGTLDDRYTDDTACPEGDVDWLAETGDFFSETPGRGFVGRITLKAEISPGAWVETAVMTDSDGVWRARDKIRATRKKNITLSAVPAPCDHFRVRLRGRGGCRIYAMETVAENRG